MRIHLVKTDRDWEVIEARIAELGKCDLNTFLRGQIYKLRKEFEKNPTKFNRVVPRKVPVRKKSYRHWISDPDDQKDLEVMAQKMKMSVSELIDQKIIAPLLLQDMLSGS